MSGARLHALDDGGWRLEGPLGFGEVTGVLEALSPSADSVRVDLGALEAVDSAGLALLVEWQRRLQAAGGRLELRQAPEQLRRLAEISGVATLLGLSEAEPDAST
ncbi:STAS domain-containing protein [Spiribacter halobius]|uniref:Sulfate transporter n=1 Tax=Sediminicurvatus halobius TaxID=2182432 RepID=A0A2U2N7N7_9GAMM|nr:STAS domain-containing protein [Spiribacter halobius]PWG65196.1 sulfate transporter [Spiribacter halobius]UEX78850.1 STAS domain-containing protein [Spiribacter halobius]